MYRPRGPRWHRPLLAAACGAVWTASCAIDLQGTGQFSAVDAGPDVKVIPPPLPPPPPPFDSGLDVATADAADAGVDVGPVPCPSGRGPAMIDLGAFCIDSTEVTVAQYAQFLDAGPGDAGVPPVCGWNVSYAPRSDAGSNPAKQSFPVTGVDWCDAYMFCAWAGKRLCGKIGGGPAPYNAHADASVNEWMFACTGGVPAQKPFPYGAVYDGSACNGYDLGVLRPTDAGAQPGCQGGFPGVFDMSGNVTEWEDSCEPYDAAPDAAACSLRGGAYNVATPAGLQCDARITYVRNEVFGGDFIGFRCCAR